MPILATARCTLHLLVKKASALARAADLATIEQAWTLSHALRPRAPSGTLALARIRGTCTGAIKSRCALIERNILAKVAEAGASTATSIGVITNV